MLLSFVWFDNSSQNFSTSRASFLFEFKLKVVSNLSSFPSLIVSYTTIPDRIEAGTYMAAIAATRGKGIIRNIYPSHLTFFTSKLMKMGANVNLIEPTAIKVSCNRKLNVH